MSFLNFAKAFVKNMTQTNLLKHSFPKIVLILQEINQTRGFKAEVFHHSRGVFSNDQAPRGKHYQAKVMKRKQTYGLETRLQSRGGKQILWRKILKGPSGWVQFVAAP